MMKMKSVSRHDVESFTVFIGDDGNSIFDVSEEFATVPENDIATLADLRRYGYKFSTVQVIGMN